MVQPTQFPLYLMIVNGIKKFLTLKEAGEAHDSIFGKIEFGEYVLAADFSVRVLTDDDKKLISDFADKTRSRKKYG